MSTHHSSLEAEVRKIIASAELKPGDPVYFLRHTFVSDLATFIQRCQDAAVAAAMQRWAPSTPIQK